MFVFYSCVTTGSNVTSSETEEIAEVANTEEVAEVADTEEAVIENNPLVSEQKQEEFEKIDLPDFGEVQADNGESENLDILPKIVKPYNEVALPSPIIPEKELPVMPQSLDYIPFSLENRSEIAEKEPERLDENEELEQNIALAPTEDDSFILIEDDLPLPKADLPEEEPDTKVTDEEANKIPPVVPKAETVRITPPPIPAKSLEKNRVAEILLPIEVPVNQQPKEEEPDRVVYYEENDRTVEIELDRMGWIYLGEKILTEKPSESSAILESRRLIPERSSTIFTFSLNGEGPFRLVFQLQDMEGRATVSDIALEPSPNMLEDVLPLEVALALQPEEVAIVTPEEEPGISSESPKQLSSQDIISSINTAEKLANAGQHSAAITLLEAALTADPLMTGKDKLYYLLGQSYEAEGEKRNPEKAVYYYKKLMEGYPFSTYYDKAENRSIFLSKHFLFIR